MGSWVSSLRTWIIVAISVVLIGAVVLVNTVFSSEAPIRACAVVTYVDDNGDSRYTARVETEPGNRMNLACNVHVFFAIDGSPNTQGDVAGGCGCDLRGVDGVVSHSGRLDSKINGVPVSLGQRPPGMYPAFEPAHEPRPMTIALRRLAFGGCG